ncbi:Gfo/Idh/MocA family protein [Halobacillus sp. BBL2006]|uniref:Gfo/Idh/MocA family protein n=1 Tax=Halobacillus sp. BBL2006 TaxID=1543706 RepID=UPI0005438130|nr:Gfo/Idh/MocA family oxidoreductase [Halobacillus sp. BBL2006]KHE72108.1 oxidoreductase [Halobacillus sp. BBL2006]
MIRFGIIGTNTITEKFLQAGKQHPEFEFIAVYSRTEERAQEFAAKHGAAHTFTSIKNLAESTEIDAVYIASPNSFHAEQAILCMENGKHVLCEKPMASNQKEVASMINVARREGVLLMEAVKSTFLPGFTKIRENLHKIGRVRRYVGNFCKYSSRYDAYKEGTVLNAFNPKFSNGSLMDLGVYGVYPMVVLFGDPKTIHANGVLLESGVDGEGSMIAEYEGMEAIIMHSKIQHSYAPSEIQGEEGAVIIPDISEPRGIEIRYKDGTVEPLTPEDTFDPMFYEIQEFITLLQSQKIQSSVNSHENTLIAAKVMEEARRKIGLVFPNDLN